MYNKSIHPQTTFFKILLAILLLTGMLMASCSGTATPQPQAPIDPPPAEDIGMANPASVFCEEQGYQVEIRTEEDGGQYGVCIFPDGSECEEWSFFRNECGPGVESWQTYAQPDYGFSFRYPPEWTLTENSSVQNSGRGAPASIELHDGATRLMIQYKHKDEDVFLGSGGLAAGEIIEAEPVSFFGETIKPSMLVYGGKVKSIFFGAEAGDLEFFVMLDEEIPTGGNYDAVDLVEPVQTRMNSILALFEWTE